MHQKTDILQDNFDDYMNKLKDLLKLLMYLKKK